MSLFSSSVLLIFVYFLFFVSCSDKISPGLKERLEKGGKVNALVSFNGVEDICKLGSVSKSRLGANRANFLSDLKTQLQSKMTSSQAGVLNLFSKRTVSPKFTQFWLINSILVEDADLSVVQSIAEDPNVSEINEEPNIESEDGMLQKQVKSAELKPNGEPQPNLKFLKVPEAWELLGGSKGDGIRVGIMDSGVRHTHEALKDSWLGKYGWYDPGDRKPEPWDETGHGTMCLGFATGGLGLGVAPNAKWMACKRLENSFSSVIECAQWFVCPTLPDGSEPDCSQAPHVITNSWGYRWFDVRAPPRDIMNQTVMDTLIECWHAAGIIPVFANMNNGPNCNTGRYPGDSPRVISVGATDMTGQVVSYSSRGPAKINIKEIGTEIKPYISAPAEGMLSPSWKGDDLYRREESGGTSSATPHVAGAIALLLSKHKDLTFDQVKTMLAQSADKTVQTTDQYENCGNVTLDQFPNNLVGHGVMNVLNLLKMKPTAV